MFNIYDELNYKNAEDMLVKAKIVTKLRETSKQMDKNKIAEILNISTTSLDKILKGQFREYSVTEIDGFYNTIINHVTHF